MHTLSIENLRFRVGIPAETFSMNHEPAMARRGAMAEHVIKEAIKAARLGVVDVEVFAFPHRFVAAYGPVGDALGWAAEGPDGSLIEVDRAQVKEALMAA